jgi:hypothetical protein
MIPIDPAKQAEELAQVFFNLSNAVDDFRLRNFASISASDQQQLKAQAQALDTRGQQCTADALGGILQEIQPHMPNVKQATQAAKDALAHLNDVAKAMSIVDSAVTLLASVATGDLGSIGDNLQNLAKVING